MIREICKDEKFLAQKAEQATPDDIQTATDLLETLEAHKDGCVGMAANMIGVNKRIIAVENQDTYLVLFNPVILKKTDPYDGLDDVINQNIDSVTLEQLAQSLPSANEGCGGCGAKG